MSSYFFGIVKHEEGIVNKTIENITFTPKKSTFSGKLCVFRKGAKGEGWYNIINSIMTFHISWIDFITECSSDHRIFYFSGGGGVEVVQKDTNGKWKSIITGRTVNNNAIHGSYNFYEYIDNYENNGFGDFITAKFKCSSCGNTSNISSLSNIRNTCMDCYLKDRKFCGICGNEDISKNFKNVKSHGVLVDVCYSCLSKIATCSICGNDVIEFVKVEDVFVCEECLNKNRTKYIKCSECGKFFNKDGDSIKKSYTGIYRCNACRFCKSFPSRIDSINEYTFKPKPIFRGKETGNKLFYGTEIELISSPRANKNHDSVALYIQSIINDDDEFIYTKYDRSIGSDGMDGFEVVTHPFSYKWLTEDGGKDKIHYMLKTLANSGCNAFYNNTCGMHIHMSKNAFNDTTLFNFLKMIYENKDFSVMISERTDYKKIDRYSSFDFTDSELRAMVSNRNNNDMERHRAINLNSPNTVEIRIFRSTLSIFRFMKNIEFCHSLFDYCRTNSFCNLEDYKKFIIKNKENFPHLTEFLMKKGELSI